MRLKEFLKSDFVVLRLSSSDVEGVLDEVARRAADTGVGAADTVREKLLERERQHPTVMGSGLAIPHATVPGLAAPSIGVALAGEGVDFGGEEDDPVRIFFVLLSPPGHEREHVKLLARICRLARHHGFLDDLLGAQDEAAVVECILAVDEQHV